MNTILKIIFISVMLLKMSPVLADTLVTKNGNVLEGKIIHCIGNMVSIKTKDGIVNVNRDINKGQARDIIEVGYFKPVKKISGVVRYLDEDTLDLGTSKGTLTISRTKIRSITLSHEHRL